VTAPFTPVATRFAIGTRYRDRRVADRVWTVTDILFTFNSQGECVKIRYVAQHPMSLNSTGVVEDGDVCETTIAKGVYALTGQVPA